MALRPPDAPSLHFKERDGFITAGAVEEEDAASEEESTEEEYVEEEETVEEEESVEETAEDEEFIEEEGVEEEAVEEETVEEETPAEETAQSVKETKQTKLNPSLPKKRSPFRDEPEQTTQTAQSDQSAQSVNDGRTPTVITQLPNTGGRTGSALPSPQEMAGYAQPENRGQAIIRHFEEEDRRMSEQLSTQTAKESESSSIFDFQVAPPDVGGGKWLFLIAALTILGYTVVRLLATDPIKPSKARRDELTVGNTIPKPPVVKPTVRMPSPPSDQKKLSKEQLIEKALKEVRAASETDGAQKSAPAPRPIKRASTEMKTAYATEETKKMPRPRPAPKPDSSKDEIKHIEIRI